MNAAISDRAYLREFLAERVHLYVSEHLTEYPALQSNTKLQEMVSYSAEGMILQLQSWCMSGKIPSTQEHFTVSYPDGVWQTFKAKFMPHWFKEKFPVKLHLETVVSTTNHYFVCPHLVTDPLNMHVKFMATGSPHARHF